MLYLLFDETKRLLRNQDELSEQ